MDTLLEMKEKKAKKVNKPKWLLVTSIATVAILILSAFTISDSYPEVDSSELYVDKVKRGTITRDVRAPGNLVPNTERWLSTRYDSEVEQKLLEPGAKVNKDTVIMQLLAPELVQQYRQLELDLKVAKADSKASEEKLKNDLLAQEAKVASIEAERQQASVLANIQEELFESKMVPEFTLKETKLKVEQLQRQLDIEKKRLKSIPKLHKSIMNADAARIEQLDLKVSLYKEMVDSLSVKAGIDGILQEVSVEEGQQLSPGTTVARVASQNDLKAELRVQESQAKDVEIGQIVTIDTRGSTIEGEVFRIDPSVVDGTVTVDIKLPKNLPSDARPDLRIDGTIVIERLDNVTYISKPSKWRKSNQAFIYKMNKNGTAARTQIQYGKSSVSYVQILKGLKEGDEVILSDMSAVSDAELVELSN